MYKVDISTYLKDISKSFPGENKAELEELFKNLVFKLEKNLYHLENIKRIINSSSKEKDFFHLMPAYFEAESLLVTMRSTIDMNLHIINFCLDLKIPSKDVYMHNIYRSNLPHHLKDVFNRYTKKHNNPIWKFIYTFRNEIVHEKSIFQKMTMRIEEIENRKYLFVNLNQADIDLYDRFVECLKFLDRFTERTLTALELHLRQKKA